ncbi:MAG: molybdopterin molybdotransferase MoeA [Myxococcaceae bacterium]
MNTDMSRIEVEDAVQRLLELVPAPVLEEVSVSEAIGRAISEPVRARRTLPPWDNSAMDGYAVRAEDTPGSLKIGEVIFAGARPTRSITQGTCARIMTGAPLPQGANAVVMQEHVRIEGDQVGVPAANPQQNVRPSGEEAREGELLLEAGTPLGIPEAGLLWGQGIQRVRVPRRPRVAILSTGDELCSLEAVTEDRIVDTNSLALEVAVRRAGGTPTRLGIAPDRLDAVEALLRQTAEFDLVLTSAGVSVGEKDFVREAMTSLGVKLSFWRVALKPGKPLAVGTRGKTIFIGLPGNPTSSLVTFELFVRPTLRRWLGLREPAHAAQGGIAGAPYAKAPGGVVHFVRVRAVWEKDEWVVYPLSSQSSGALRSAVSATHLMRVPKESSGVASGERVELIPVSWTA